MRFLTCLMAVTRFLFGILAVLFCLSVQRAQSKTVLGRFQLDAGDFVRGPEYEITKYSFAVGESRVQGKFTYKDPGTQRTSPALCLFADEKWDAYHKAPSCVDKTRLADSTIPIGEYTQSHAKVARIQEGTLNEASLRPIPNHPGFLQFEFNWTIEHKTRTRGWFLVAVDCALEQFDTHVPPLNYEISLFNPGNTHLPADEFGLPRLYLIVFIGMVAYLGFLLNLLRIHWRETGNRVHLVVRLLLAAYFTQLFSLFFELIHLRVYKDNGYGIFIFDLLSEILEGLSQTIISFVLICLASGWTLIETESNKSRGNSVATIVKNPASLFKGPNIAVFVIVALLVAISMLQILSKSYDDDFSKFHNHDTIPGRIIVGMRSLLGVAYIVSLHINIRRETARGGNRVADFMKHLMLLGGVWFLAFPAVVFSSGFFAHYHRHRFVSTGVLTLQTLCLGIMGYQFLSNHSSYFKISVLADSGVLPGAGGLIRPPKASKD